MFKNLLVGACLSVASLSAMANVCVLRIPETNTFVNVKRIDYAKVFRTQEGGHFLSIMMAGKELMYKIPDATTFASQLQERMVRCI